MLPFSQSSAGISLCCPPYHPVGKLPASHDVSADGLTLEPGSSQLAKMEISLEKLKIRLDQ